MHQRYDTHDVLVLKSHAMSTIVIVELNCI